MQKEVGACLRAEEADERACDEAEAGSEEGAGEGGGQEDGEYTPAAESRGSLFGDDEKGDEDVERGCVENAPTSARNRSQLFGRDGPETTAPKKTPPMPPGMYPRPDSVPLGFPQ